MPLVMGYLGLGMSRIQEQILKLIADKKNEKNNERDAKGGVHGKREHSEKTNM